MQTLQRQVSSNAEQFKRLEQAKEPLKRMGEASGRIEEAAECFLEAPEGSEAQSQALQSMVETSSELARANTQLAHINSQQLASSGYSNIPLESAQRAAQTAEAAQILAQSNQVVIRDLIEGLRLGRGG